MTPQSPLSRIRWLSVRNLSSEDAPPFAALRVVGATRLDEQTIVTVDKPDATLARHYMLNGPARIAAGGHGDATFDAPALVLFDAAHTPAAGEGWGPRSGQWSLARGYPGFTILGDNSGAGAASKTLVMWEPINRLIGKTTSAIAANASGTINLWVGAGGGEAVASPTTTFTGINWTGVDIDSGAKVIALWVNAAWYIEPWECPA